MDSKKLNWIVLTVPHAGCLPKNISRPRSCDELAEKASLCLKKYLEKYNFVKTKRFISRIKRTEYTDENRFNEYTQNESIMWRNFENFSSKNINSINFALDVHSFYMDSPYTPNSIKEDTEIYVLEDSPTDYASEFVINLKKKKVKADIFSGKNNAIHEIFRKKYNIKSFLIEFRENLTENRLKRICKLISETIVDLFIYNMNNNNNNNTYERKMLKDPISQIKIPTQDGDILFERIGDFIHHKSPESDIQIKPFEAKKFSWRNLIHKIIENDIMNIESFIDKHNSKFIEAPPPEKRKAPDYSLDTRELKIFDPEKIPHIHKDLDDFLGLDLWEKIFSDADVNTLEELYEAYLNRRGDYKILITYHLIKKKRILWKNRGYYKLLFEKYEIFHQRKLKFEPKGYIFEIDDLVVSTNPSLPKGSYTYPPFDEIEKVDEIEFSTRNYRSININIPHSFKKIIGNSFDIYVGDLTLTKEIICGDLDVLSAYNSQLKYPLKRLYCRTINAPYSIFHELEYIRLRFRGFNNNELPISIKYVETGSFFNFNTSNINPRLESIVTSGLVVYNGVKFPDSITTLDFQKLENHNFIEEYPKNLKNLYTSEKHYKFISEIPKSITSLKAEKLTNIYIDWISSLEIKGAYLPKNLDKFLKLEKLITFSLEEEDNFPFSIYYVPTKFPPNLKVLIDTNIGNFEPWILNLPDTIEILKLNMFHSKQILPKGLVELEINDGFGDKKNEHKLDFNEYTKLKKIKLSSHSRVSWNLESKNFPPNLEEFDSSKANFLNDITVLPPNLRILKLGTTYKGKIDNSAFHLNIKELYIGRYIHQQPLKFPNGILNLKFGYYFNQEITRFPNFLRTLEFDFNYANVLPPLPNTLLEFDWGAGLLYTPKLDYVYILRIPSYTILRRFPSYFTEINGNFDKQKYKNLEEAVKHEFGNGFYYVHPSFSL